jgi:phosphatidylglycerol:prolipoprotein diacylglycerol transferase
VVVAVLGRRSKAQDLVIVGAASAAVCLMIAIRGWGQRATLAPMPIYSFGAMLTMGLVFGWLLADRIAKLEGISRDVIAGTYFATGIAGLVGARLLYVLTNLGDFHSVEEALAFNSGGLVFYGAVLGGGAGAWLFLRGKGVPLLAWLDIAATSVCAGAVLGRVGCYLAGCDYGVPLGKGAPGWLARIGTFPRWPDEVAGPTAGSPAWIDHVLRRGLPLDSKASLPVHPTQLYESLALAALLAGLLALRRSRRFRGEVFVAFIMGYGAIRFLIETLRDDPERRLFGPEGSPRVIWAVGALVFAVGFFVGPSRSIRSPVRRTTARAAAFVAPFAVSLLASGRLGTIALSTSQWIALASFVAFVPFGRKLDREAPKAGASA